MASPSSRQSPSRVPLLVSAIGVCLFGAVACDDATQSGTQPLDVANPSELDIVYPDVPRADTAPPPDVGPADTALPDVAPADTAVPDTAPADTSGPDTSTPDTVLPDTAVPDTSVPDTSTPDTSVPDTSTPDTSRPDSSTPDTSTPDTGPDVCTPSCAAGSCGPDGCGGQCGCSGGTTCNATTLLCETPPTPGDTCGAPIALTTDGNGGFTGSGNLSGAGISDRHTLGTCPRLDALVAATGSGTRDMAFTFVAPATRAYRVAVTSGSEADTLFALFTGAGCSNATCIGYVDNAVSGGTDSRNFDLAAGTIYTLLVDTWSTSSHGVFTITVTPVCTPDCAAGCGGSDGCGGTCGCPAGSTCNLTNATCEASQLAGDTCASAIALSSDGAGGFTGSGDLDAPGLTDAHARGTCEMAAGISFSGVGIVDQAFVFTPPSSGTWRVAVTSTSGVDAAYTLYDDTACAPAACLGAVDDGLSGGVDAHEFELVGGAPHTVVVESYSTNFTGPFTIAVTPVACTPTCGATCGVDDGCGGTCGCGDGLVCNAGTCTAPETPGDSCESAIALELMPDGDAFMGVGDNSQASLTDRLDPEACEQIGFYSHSGASTREQVFSFVAPESGLYAFGVVPAEDVDISFMVYTGLPCDGSTCIGYMDDADAYDPSVPDQTGIEAAEAELVAGQTYYIAVESFNASIAPGPFTVLVLLPGFEEPAP